MWQENKCIALIASESLIENYSDKLLGVETQIFIDKLAWDDATAEKVKLFSTGNEKELGKIEERGYWRVYDRKAKGILRKRGSNITF